ncbi:hypothetical protein LWI28_025198 [Acer negundo]|uniref:Uncharacterized protein n=1 Tax=Acer negundo TaxID=4023 RepID=A0AAD5NFM2_ACENE|nr:hypothetical protein LWI28_025198 [Acer negundo]
MIDPKPLDYVCVVFERLDPKSPPMNDPRFAVTYLTKILGAKEALTTRSTPRVRFLALSDSDRSKLFSIFFFHYKVRGVLGNTVATVTFHHGYRS